MGTKFANLHVKTTNQTLIAEALRQLNGQTDLMHPRLNILDAYINKTEKKKPSEPREIKVTYYTCQDGKWTSLLNDHFQWGAIEQIGQRLSTLVSEPVMTVGFFDEDIFEFTLFEDGNVTFKKYFCGEWTKEDYGLDQEQIVEDELTKVLEINREAIEPLLNIDNPEQAVNELEKLLSIPLWVDADWIDYDPELAAKYAKLEIEAM